MRIKGPPIRNGVDEKYKEEKKMGRKKMGKARRARGGGGRHAGGWFIDNLEKEDKEEKWIEEGKKMEK